MPTVLLLDVSLSMCRLVHTADSDHLQQMKNIALTGLKSLLDYQAAHCPLELTAFVVFSSLYEVKVPFTRDMETLKKGMSEDIECFDKTNILNGLEGAQQLISEEWGTDIPTRVIMVTDGNPGVGWMLACGNNAARPEFTFQLHIVCLTPSSDENLKLTLRFYQRLVDPKGADNSASAGQIWTPEGDSLTISGVESLFRRMGEQFFKPSHGTLVCGGLSSPVSICPPRENYTHITDFDIYNAKVSDDIQVCGFMPIGDVGNPAIHSRHLVLGLGTGRDESAKYINILSHMNPDAELAKDSSAVDEAKNPSLCVLLHGSLKVEGMVAICRIGTPDWYGMLFSWADGKKKSNLMLAAFECGASAGWLRNWTHLGNPSISTKLSQQEMMRFKEKKSYTQNQVVWLKPADIQADVQKILRHARKLPDKSVNFYKELNRVRKAALASGFYEFLASLAHVLERECHLLAPTCPREASIHLTHAVAQLRNSGPKSYQQPIVPFNA